MLDVLGTNRKVYLCQVNQRYGNNVFLPYSVGMLWAYAKTIDSISSHYELGDFIYLREPIREVVGRMQFVDVIGISAYVWNWEYSKALAAAVKHAHPNALVVFGGPQVPDRAEGFFERHPYIDILVHQEGEIAFAEILQERLRSSPDYRRVAGLTVRNAAGEEMRTGPGSRVGDLSVLPSPYLSGVFDLLLEAPYDFHASQETHRGCPYACTFCDWGSSTFSKVRALPTDRIFSEFEWFGEHKIDLLYSCDANYGILKRDLEITEALAAAKRKFGFPNRFRAAYAKKSNDRVFEIASILNRHDMNKGVTLSLQSVDSHTLDVIKRSNIKLDEFEKWIRRYQDAGISTYTELILGLPGESYHSFMRGLDQVLDAGQHDSINVYPCMVLPNSELNEPSYRSSHAIESVSVPMIWSHASIDPTDVQERFDIVVTTSTMDRSSWRLSYATSLLIQALHCLSLTQSIALFVRHYWGIKYSSFYSGLLDAGMSADGTLIGQACAMAFGFADDVLNGRAFACRIPEFGEIEWPPEEAIFLHCIRDKALFYRELTTVLDQSLNRAGLATMERRLVPSLVSYSCAVVCGPSDPPECDVTLDWTIHDFVTAARTGHTAQLAAKSHVMRVKPRRDYRGQPEAYAREVVWYGRKGGVTRHTDIAIRERTNGVACPIWQDGVSAHH